MSPFMSRVLVNGLLLLFLKEIFSSIQIQGFIPLILGAFILALIEFLLRPLIILLTLPINILTLGFFTLVINAFLLRFTAFLVPGFFIYSFGGAFFGALLLSIFRSLPRGKPFSF